MKFAFGGLALFVAAAGLQPAAQAQLPTAAQSLKTTTLTIQGAHVHKYQVELALTGEEQEIGLMFRKTMAPSHGMIFPMSPPRPATFWMKNTYLPLDILFIGPDHRIVQISANAKPMSEDLIPCDQPVSAVLELNAGISAKEGLKAGDKVDW